MKRHLASTKCPRCERELNYLVVRVSVYLDKDSGELCYDTPEPHENPTYYCPYCGTRVAVLREKALEILRKEQI